jgi:hypothetical protein
MPPEGESRRERRATRSGMEAQTKVDGTPVTVYVNEPFEVVNVKTR